MGANSGPTGRKTRWYMMRAWRDKLGKHGLVKLWMKNGTPIPKAGRIRFT